MNNSEMEREPRPGLFGGLAGKGLLCLALGAVLLLLADSGPVRPLGWVAVGLGVLLLVLHLFARPAQRANAAREDPAMGQTRPSVLAGLRNAGGTAVIEPVFVDTIAVNPEAEAADAALDEAAGEADDDPFADTREHAWNPNVLANIDAPRFERVCLVFYAQAGFSTSSRAHETEGGIDIWLQSRLMPAPRFVRCKYWGGHTVDLKAMRDFLTDMSLHGLQNGTYVTSSSFDADAIEFAKSNGVQVQDAASLLKLIAQRSAQQQAELLDAAYAVD